MVVSPLYKTIIQAIGGAPLHPDESVILKPVVMTPRIQDFAGKLDAVFCVLDTNAERDRIVSFSLSSLSVPFSSKNVNSALG